MALNTYGELWKYMLLRCPIAGPMLAQEWITFSFREIAENASSRGCRKSPVTRARRSLGRPCGRHLYKDPNVVGTGTDMGRLARRAPVPHRPLDADLHHRIGRRRRQTLTLTEVWGAATTLSVNYLIYQAYFVMPDDFLSFITCWDPAFNWQLWTRIRQVELNLCDAQRANSGTAYALSFPRLQPSGRRRDAIDAALRVVAAPVRPKAISILVLVAPRGHQRPERGHPALCPWRHHPRRRVVEVCRVAGAVEATSRIHISISRSPTATSPPSSATSWISSGTMTRSILTSDQYASSGLGMQFATIPDARREVLTKHAF
jgi:hypothetical protein